MSTPLEPAVTLVALMAEGTFTYRLSNNGRHDPTHLVGTVIAGLDEHGTPYEWRTELVPAGSRDKYGTADYEAYGEVS